MFCRLFVLFAGGDLGGDVSGFCFKGGKDAIAFAAGGFEVEGFEGIGGAYGWSLGGSEGDTEPPGSVVLPDVVVGVVFGAAGGSVVFRGHRTQGTLVFNNPGFSHENAA